MYKHIKKNKNLAKSFKCTLQHLLFIVFRGVRSLGAREKKFSFFLASEETSLKK